MNWKQSQIAQGLTGETTFTNETVTCCVLSTNLISWKCLDVSLTSHLTTVLPQLVMVLIFWMVTVICNVWSSYPVKQLWDENQCKPM